MSSAPETELRTARLMLSPLDISYADEMDTALAAHAPGSAGEGRERVVALELAQRALAHYPDARAGGRRRRSGGRGRRGKEAAEVEPALQRAREFAAAGRPVLVNVWLDKTDFRDGAISM